MSEVEALRNQVAALAQRVQALQDYVEITQLVAQYGPSVDSGSAEAAAGLWTEDGVFDVVGYGPFTGREEIAAMVNGEGHQWLIMNGCGHVLTVPHVVVDGDDATGRSYALNIRWDPKLERFWVARLSANTWRWHRTSEGWRIVERVNANLDGAPGPRTMLMPSMPAASESR
jgi:SnoaL-like domain